MNGSVNVPNTSVLITNGATTKMSSSKPGHPTPPPVIASYFGQGQENQEKPFKEVIGEATDATSQSSSTFLSGFCLETDPPKDKATTMCFNCSLAKHFQFR
jgi:hypothetical protein